ncbi:MAG: hypothetical protein UE643_01540, partial [Gemmiger sp.]|nr:hypothetical protein [Gemmiger sp.]
CILRNNLHSKFYKLHLGRNSCAICAGFYLQYWYNGIERRRFHGNLLFRQQGHFPNQRVRRSLLSSAEITRAMSERSDDAFARSESVKHARTVCSCPGVLLFFARSPKASG